MSKDLAIITGASRGIGKATAQAFIGKGMRVLNMSRTESGVDGVEDFQIDFLSSESIGQKTSRLLRVIGAPERIHLIHNAAMLIKDSVDSVDLNEMRDVLQLNLFAAAELNTVLIAHMKAGSSIIYVGSTLGTKAVANTYSYVVSKHATVGQMRATCQDMAGKAVHTACVCPGFTETEMLQEHLGANPEVRAEITSNIAYGRLLQPEEIAQAIWFCSQNPAINGAVIDANLGQIER